MNTIRIVNIVIAGIGVLVFGALLAWMKLAPQDFDESTRTFAVEQVRNSLDDKLSAAANSDTVGQLSEFAGRYSSTLQSRIDEIKGSLDAGLDQFIVDILAAACKFDCERRVQAEEAVQVFFESQIERYGVALDRLESIVGGEYDRVMQEIRTDLSIFSFTNLVAMAMALLLAVFKGRAAAHLLPFSIGLSLTTFVTMVWYLFGQDWMMTVLFSDYWGWSYAALLSVLAAFMVDIAINKARVTTVVFNMIGNAVGSTFQFVSC